MDAHRDRLRVTYRLTCGDGEDPGTKAREIALEQTVELPDGCLPAGIEERIVGRVESLVADGPACWRSVIAFDPVTFAGEIPQLVNLLFGNVSLKAGIQICDVEWPAAQLAELPGPRYGIPGLRARCGWDEPRPLLCAALKPMGASPSELAQRCESFAEGGIDIVKDDHGLANQTTAAFTERVARCQEAVARANARTGGSSIYVPNLPGTAGRTDEHLELAVAAGCRGVLLSPMVVGLDTVRWVRESYDLALFAHPSLSGAFFGSAHGIAPEVLLGRIFRVVGADAVIYPNVGGRFPFSAETCEAINRGLREPLGPIRGAFPMPGGGIDVARVPHWIERYGTDTILLVGASLYAWPDLRRASRELVESTRAAARRCAEA